MAHDLVSLKSFWISTCQPSFVGGERGVWEEGRWHGVFLGPRGLHDQIRRVALSRMGMSGSDGLGDIAWPATSDLQDQICRTALSRMVVSGSGPRLRPFQKFYGIPNVCQVL